MARIDDLAIADGLQNDNYVPFRDDGNLQAAHCSATLRGRELRAPSTTIDGSAIAGSLESADNAVPNDGSNSRVASQEI